MIICERRSGDSLNSFWITVPNGNEHPLRMKYGHLWVKSNYEKQKQLNNNNKKKQQIFKKRKENLFWKNKTLVRALTLYVSIET